MRALPLLLLAAAACGGEPPATDPSTTKTTTSSSSTPASSAAPSAGATATTDAAHGIPSSCAGGSTDPCVPDAGFVKRLCDGSYPDVALLLMSKDMPFTHAYLRGSVDGWNAEGGASARAKLLFDEEVLILKKRSGNTPGGIQVSGSGGYLVMRWDGNCYTLDDGEVTTHRPPAPKGAPIVWRFLQPSTQDALSQTPQVSTASIKRSKECKGATSGDVSLACQKADEALSVAVVAAVRGGATIPTPARAP
ncbi:MAG TPA: hypothetical protein VLM85_14985 [Polyangiaceae bacterium]|nr:hypothetical protein [Polyangiaceae bacterium]